MSTVSNVTNGKPKIGGAIYRGALGTALPTDAKTALAEAFKCLGYCSDDGLVNSNSPKSESIKAWGGDTVLTYQKEKPDDFKYTLLEVLNPDVLAAVYGTANVSGTLATGISIKANAIEQEESVWVFELVMRSGALKRIVVPDGKITAVGDVSYTDSDAVGYETTLSAMPDGTGNTHYEYILRAAQA